MASSSAKKPPLFFVLTLLSCSLHIHARGTQFFNKIPTTNYLPNDQQLQNNQQPSFLPENENGYGLYGHESGQLPPSATLAGESATKSTTATTPYNSESEQSLNKHLPKNYNPVAYVTEPEDINDDTKFTGETSFTTNSNSNGARNYYNAQQEEEEESEFGNYPSSTSTNDRNYYYNGGNSFTSQPQGMSDTRFLENGKYFYDVNTDKYSNNHPYERIRARNENINRNYYGNTGNAYQFGNGNQNQYEENYLP